MNLILGLDIGIAKTAVVLFDTDTRGLQPWRGSPMMV